ncbi:hypothetical protein SAMN05216268_103224 [Streptomyces yunnanensis]|uniref:Uncharacterized protein n=1 Tax=Streptomyces yunnanensis TaxID=156453 RepID=A0A9X8MNS6_9ACTN|nr:hypothetical protein SAMN05216268_103224 [Streptomyces yunnanensis]
MRGLVGGTEPAARYRPRQPGPVVLPTTVSPAGGRRTDRRAASRDGRVGQPPKRIPARPFAQSWSTWARSLASGWVFWQDGPGPPPDISSLHGPS